MRKGRSKSISSNRLEGGPLGKGPLTGWVQDWETFRSDDNHVQLFGMLQHREPWEKSRALVVLHGMGEHSGRYLQLPKFLGSEVDAIYLYDHRGHGRSEGLRGHVERFDRLVDDAVAVIRRLDEKLKKRFGTSEIHLLGHSLGGHLALRALLQYPDLPVRSAIFSAPLLRVKARVPLGKKIAAAVLSQVWGSLQISTELDAAGLSHDPEVVRAYRQDRLVHDKMTPQFYSQMKAAMANTLSRTTGLPVPVMFLVPSEDPIVDSRTTLEYYRELKHRDKLLKTYPGFYHEPMNEVGREQVFQDIAEFIRGNHAKPHL